MASAAYLPVDLVEEIFLRLDDAADLVRASAACAAFRRVASDGGFLRRYRSLHRRPVLGLLGIWSSASEGLRFHPAEPPRRSAQAARAVARAAAMSSAFLPASPTEHYWHVHDARDGRVLLSPSRTGRDRSSVCLSSFSSLLVYDPLQCKHVQIPPIPRDIIIACKCTRSLEQGFSWCDCDCRFMPFLVPAAGDDEDDLSFQVVCNVLSDYKFHDFVLEAFVYSTVTGKWRGGLASVSEAGYPALDDLCDMERHYAHGCFYWVDYFEKDMLVLDMNEIKFSVVRLPPETTSELFKIVVEAAEQDRIGLLVLRDEENTLDLYSKALGSANDCCQWRHDGVVVTLLDSYEWMFGGPAQQGYALLQRIPRDEYEARWRSYEPKTNTQFCTVELQTLLVEQLCVTAYDPSAAFFLYASFPPPFAPPRI